MKNDWSDHELAKPRTVHIIMSALTFVVETLFIITNKNTMKNYIDQADKLEIQLKDME